MAEAPGKPKSDRDKKEGSPSTPPEYDIIFLLFGVVILSAVIGRLVFVFGSGSADVLALFRLDDLMAYLESTWLPRLRVISYLLSILAIAGIVYSVRGIERINKEELSHYGSKPPKEREDGPTKKWQEVVSHLNSDNPNDWKIAIIEADIMLERLLDEKGFRGETMGDKLKSVNKAYFANIEAAWEAHKVRNQIAHEGAEFIITYREAQRIVALYESVFREFKVI